MLNQDGVRIEVHDIYNDEVAYGIGRSMTADISPHVSVQIFIPTDMVDMTHPEFDPDLAEAVYHWAHRCNYTMGTFLRTWADEA